jgi:hypothetical protein
LVRQSYRFQQQPHILGVREWKAHYDPQLSGKNIAPDVVVWWVWRDISFQKTHVAGYHQRRAWVFDLNTSELFTNFGPSEEFVGFGPFVEGGTSYQRYWVSSYSGPGKGVMPETTFRGDSPDPEITAVEFRL